MVFNSDYSILKLRQLLSFLQSFPTMKVKAGLIIYSLIIPCVPPRRPPNNYTLFITILGTVVACCATAINLLYFRSLPSIQFTWTQPLIMATHSASCPSENSLSSSLATTSVQRHRNYSTRILFYYAVL